MAFGPISDVSGFTHRDGQTYQSLLLELREKLNLLIAQYNQLPTYIRNLQSDWNADFLRFQNDMAPSVDEYNALIAQLTTTIAEASAYVTTNTDYTVTTTPTGTQNPDETTDTDYTTIN